MRGTTSPRPFGRWLLGLGTVAASLAVQSEARADLHLAIGSKIEPYSYTSAYFPNANKGIAMRPDGSAAAGSESLQSTSLSPYIALFFAQKYGIVLGIDIGYAKSSGETQPMGDLTPTAENNSYFQFGVSLGTKIYFTQPRAQKVVPYLYLDVFKYFASVATDNTDITGDHASAQASMHSPTGGTLAIGAEYFFSPGFSIGSEIFGIRVSGANSDYKDAPNKSVPTVLTRYSSSYTQVAMYTGLTLNYRFQVSSSVRAAEEEGSADAPKRRRAPTSEDFIATPPPPVAPPPPSPESVD